MPADDLQAAAEQYIAVRTIRCGRREHHIDSHASEQAGGCQKWVEVASVGAVPSFDANHDVCDCPAFLAGAALTESEPGDG